jgi:hypothetical protein
MTGVKGDLLDKDVEVEIAMLCKYVDGEFDGKFNAFFEPTDKFDDNFSSIAS